MRRSTRLVLAESAALTAAAPTTTSYFEHVDPSLSDSAKGTLDERSSNTALPLPLSLPDSSPPPSNKRRSQHASRDQRRAAMLSNCATFTDDIVAALRAIAKDDADTLQRIVMGEKNKRSQQQSSTTANGENSTSEAAADSSHINVHNEHSLSTLSTLSHPHGTRFAKQRPSVKASTALTTTADTTSATSPPTLSPPAPSPSPTTASATTTTTKRPRNSSSKSKPVHVLDPARPTTLAQSVDLWIAPSIHDTTRADPLSLDIDDPTTLLHYAARHNALHCIRALVGVLGGDVAVEDAQQSLALDEAAAYDTIDAAKLLVQLGCDPYHLNNNNTTLLHSAAEQGSLAVLRWALAEVGCDVHVNHRDLSDGYTPLMYALDSKSNQAGRPAVLQLLIQYGADVNVRDKDGNSALMWAVSLGMDDVAKLLVRNRADLTLANHDGTTPYTLHDWDGSDYRVTETGHNATHTRIAEEEKKDKEKKRREKEERLAAKLKQTQAHNEQQHSNEPNGLSHAESKDEEEEEEGSGKDVEMKASDSGLDWVEKQTGKGYHREQIMHGEEAAHEQTERFAVKADGELMEDGTLACDTAGEVQPTLNGHTPNPIPTTASSLPAPTTRRPRRKHKRTVVYHKKRRQSEAEKRVLSAPIPASEQRESNGGRCKRYIFQEMLNRAVEEGDYGNIERVTRLLDEWHSARRGKRYRVFPLEYDDSYPVGPMQIAVAFENDDTSILQLLLDADIEYNKRTATGFLPIHAAANVGNANSVRLLLQHGCDPNLREESDGYTALMMAADDKDGWKVVQLLLDNEQLQLNAQDFHGNTALHWAVFKANVEVVRLLLSRMRVRRGSEALNATVANKWGNAPMHYAFYRAWKSEAGLKVLELMLAAHISWKSPINKQQLAPVQLLAGKASERGEAMQLLLRKYKVELEEVSSKPQSDIAAVAEESAEAEDDGGARDPSPALYTPSSTPSPSATTGSTTQPVRTARKGNKRRRATQPPTVLCPATDEEIKRFKPPQGNSKVKHVDPFMCFKALYVAADISGGAEPTPIPLVNHIDNTGLSHDFEYIPQCVTESGDEMKRYGKATGDQREVKAQCGCVDGCVDWRRCNCLAFFPLEQQKDLHYLDHLLSGHRPISGAHGDGSAAATAALSSFARDFWRSKTGSSLSMAGVSNASRPRRTRNSMSAQLDTAPLIAGTADSALDVSAHSTGVAHHSSLQTLAANGSMDGTSAQSRAIDGSTSTTTIEAVTTLSNEKHLNHADQQQAAEADSLTTTDPHTVTPSTSSSPSSCSSPSSPPASHPQAHLPYAPNVLRLHEVNYLCECSDTCGCPPSCPNRATQHGVHVKLQVYKTREKGWACRAMQSIRAGTFVAEYVGELLNEAESGRRLLDDYDLVGLHYMFGLKGSTYSIDPVRRGNVARLFNHSCQPNLHKLQVYRSAVRGGVGGGVGLVGGGSVSGGVDGLGVPRMVFVAARDIVRYEELCISYDYEELDHPGGCLVCNCGTKKCRHNLV